MAVIFDQYSLLTTASLSFVPAVQSLAAPDTAILDNFSQPGSNTSKRSSLGSSYSGRSCYRKILATTDCCCSTAVRHIVATTRDRSRIDYCYTVVRTSHTRQQFSFSRSFGIAVGCSPLASYTRFDRSCVRLIHSSQSNFTADLPERTNLTVANFAATDRNPTDHSIVARAQVKPVIMTRLVTHINPPFCRS